MEARSVKPANIARLESLLNDPVVDRGVVAREALTELPLIIRELRRYRNYFNPSGPTAQRATNPSRPAQAGRSVPDPNTQEESDGRAK
jgi:hypothetical protein